MVEGNLTLTERRIDDVTLITMVGALTIDGGDLVFGKRIQELVAQGSVKFVVDMKAVTYIDSAGLAMMAARLGTVRLQGGDIRLLHLTERGRRLLGVLKLATTFQMFDDEGLALLSFEK